MPFSIQKVTLYRHDQSICSSSMATAARSIPANIDDDVAIQTRLALVELLTLGSTQPAPRTADARATVPKPTGSIVERARQANETLNERVQRFKPIVQFIQEYESNLSLLRPNEQQSTNAQNPTVLQQTVDVESTAALLLEAQSDLMQFERDMRLIHTFNDRDVAGAGKLVELQTLRPRIRALEEQIARRLSSQDEIERKVLSLVQRYTQQTDTLSELFIHWDRILTEIEDGLGQMERERR